MLRILVISLFLIIPFLILGDTAPAWKFIQKLNPKASASSELIENTKKYSANNAIDNNLLSAWCEGTKGAGAGETLEVNFPPTAGLGISVFPGIGGTKKLYYENNRIKDYEVTITFQNGRYQKIKGKFDDNLCGSPDHRLCIDFEDDAKKMEACEKRLNSLCHYNDYEQGGQIFLEAPKCITKIQFKILSVYKGKKFDDTCISVLNIFGPLDQSPELIEKFKKIEETCK